MHAFGVVLIFVILMFSKSPINQATSKAMLTQMISIIFRRMETEVVWKHVPLMLLYFLTFIF